MNRHLEGIPLRSTWWERCIGRSHARSGLEEKCDKGENELISGWSRLAGLHLPVILSFGQVVIVKHWFSIDLTVSSTCQGFTASLLTGDSRWGWEAVSLTLRWKALECWSKNIIKVWHTFCRKDSGLTSWFWYRSNIRFKIKCHRLGLRLRESSNMSWLYDKL